MLKFYSAEGACVGLFNDSTVKAMHSNSMEAYQNVLFGMQDI